MKYMSFMLTTEQVKNRTKDVTRRLKWLNVKPGDRLQACVKCMGIPKGGKIEKLAIIEVVSVRREQLLEMCGAYGHIEVRREGFEKVEPVMGWPAQFIEFFCRTHKGCTRKTVITRIEFKYV